MLNIFTSNKGQGLVEYALILVLVAIVIIVILALLGPSIGNIYSNVVAHLVEDPQGGDGGGGGEDGGDDGGGEEETCYGSLLLPYLVGTATLSWLMLRSAPAIHSAVKVR